MPPSEKLPYTYTEANISDLPPTRTIEKAEVETVASENPPTENVDLEPYTADPQLIQAVDIALALGRPLLLQGEPGCGKTRLAYHVAYALGLPLEACYLKSTSRAQDFLYTYDAIRRLYDAELKAENIDIKNYIRLGGLGRAIARANYGRPSVVLLDEIDKADIDFPNDLLREIDRLEFDIPEVPEMHFAATKDCRPLIIVTHNEEKALPSAFLRRCIFHYVTFPDSEERLMEIVALHWKLRGRELRTDDAFVPQAIRVLQRLRKIENLAKKPGLSELLDWVGYLRLVENPSDEPLDTQSFESLPYRGVLLKSRADHELAADEYERIPRIQSASEMQ